jgi:hypothetical protein
MADPPSGTTLPPMMGQNELTGTGMTETFTAGVCCEHPADAKTTVAKDNKNK